MSICDTAGSRMSLLGQRVPNVQVGRGVNQSAHCTFYRARGRMHTYHDGTDGCPRAQQRRLVFCVPCARRKKSKKLEVASEVPPPSHDGHCATALAAAAPLPAVAHSVSHAAHSLLLLSYSSHRLAAQPGQKRLSAVNSAAVINTRASGLAQPATRRVLPGVRVKKGA